MEKAAATTIFQKRKNLETATQTQLRETEIKLNNIICTMTWSKKISYVSELYKKLGLLKLHDVHKLKLAKFMHHLFKNKQPKLCNHNFTTINNIHDYATRKPSRSNYFLAGVSKSAGKNKIESRGAKLWKKITENLKNKPFVSFTNTLKKIYREITDYTIRNWFSIKCTVPTRTWTCGSFATNNTAWVSVLFAVFYHFFTTLCDNV